MILECRLHKLLIKKPLNICNLLIKGRDYLFNALKIQALAPGFNLAPFVVRRRHDTQ